MTEDLRDGIQRVVQEGMASAIHDMGAMEVAWYGIGGVADMDDQTLVDELLAYCEDENEAADVLADFDGLSEENIREILQTAEYAWHWKMEKESKVKH